ncbi:MAG: DUF1015 domain-containing protein, partial [Methanomicrobiales archaeon]|nr:DUF1015 domain-containing protein [Methanomicrobiales archaeon]
HDARVYECAKKNFEDMIARGLFIRDPAPGMYLYRVKQGGSIYTGLVACPSVDDYLENRIRRHEQTRYDKEEDRTRHIETTNAHTGLVVLLYRDPGSIFSYLTSLVPEREPDAWVKTGQGVVHEIFYIADEEQLSTIESLFSGVEALYIADGHHRARSAATVAERRREAGTYTPEAGRFMAILFAENRVKIHGYSRLVTDLGSFTREAFLEALEGLFDVRPYGEIDDTVVCIPPLREAAVPMHVLHMYLDGTWYELSRRVEQPEDRVASLDVAMLQRIVMEGVLGITDPRGDPRLQYLGGARPLSDLEEKVDSGEFAVAFSMQPVAIETVLSIADEGGIMPPKSTWFEPKLLSGLVVHTL